MYTWSSFPSLRCLQSQSSVNCDSLRVHKLESCERASGAMTSVVLSPQQFLTRISSPSKFAVGNRRPRHPTLKSSSWSQSGGSDRGLQIRCLNTFLPYTEFERSVECLDNRRLGKQRLEAWQILRIVQASAVPVKGTAWANAPAVRMWRGFPNALALYYNACLAEWAQRGFQNVILQPVELPLQHSVVVMPPWLGDELVHASHRSNLLRKEPEHYSQFAWTETPDIPYVWPVPLVRVDEKKVVIVDGN